MYDQHWPIRTYQPNYPPPKFVFSGRDGDFERCGRAMDSIVCAGTIVSGGAVERCILSPNVRINSYAHVEDSILFEGVDVGRHATSAERSSTRGCRSRQVHVSEWIRTKIERTALRSARVVSS